MRTWRTGLIVAIAACLAFLAPGALHRGAAVPAGASVPTALELADHGLTTVVGLEDEGSYRLIDPIGPGGVKSLEATDEVFASTLQGGKYVPWQAYRDPFAPTPNGPPTAGPYQPHPSGRAHGGSVR